jgi:hypothetical protein
MSDFSHISDQRVKAYLEDGLSLGDYNLIAAQLNRAQRALDEDAVNLCIPFDVIEAREAAYEEACEYFGWRNLKAVHESLRLFWKV